MKGSVGEIRTVRYPTEERPEVFWREVVAVEGALVGT
jgi:hypothetical protein